MKSDRPLKVNRTVLSVADLHGQSDDAYWHSRPALDRLRAIQIHRQTAYGRLATQRLHRVLEIAQREPHAAK